jgi:adenine-specific DNA-methyltransferase
MEKKNKYLECKKTKDSYTIFVKEREIDNKGYKPKTLWNNPSYSSATAIGQLKDIFSLNNKSIFDYPKSLILMSDILKITSKPSSVILDFFAGSGTTGHAVLELNKEDGGNRQFILCTNNENGICEEVTYPRIKKVIEGYADKEPIPANVRYFKTDFVEYREDTDENRARLTERCYEILQIKESCYESEKSSVENLKFWRSTNKLLAVIFDRYDKIDDTQYTEEIAKQVRSGGVKEIVIYRFSIDIAQFCQTLKCKRNCNLSVFYRRQFGYEYFGFSKRSA